MYKDIRQYYCDACDKLLEHKMHFVLKNYSTLTLECEKDEYELDIEDKDYCSFDCIKKHFTAQIDNIEKQATKEV